MELTYAQTATLWWVNRRWRRSTTDGFTVDLRRGQWARRPGDEGDNALDPTAEQFLSGVRIMVQDTRNVLLIRWLADADETLPSSLQYALRRGIEMVFQVEEQELASERIGEGGAGVLAPLIDDPDALARVTAAALDICHINSASGEERPEETEQCGRACYRCLLSYTNQPDHALLDSGVEDAFRSLLKLLDPAFTRINLEQPAESERRHLAHHFVQRRRADVQRWLGQDDVIPLPGP